MGTGPVFDRGKKSRCREVINFPESTMASACFPSYVVKTFRCQLKAGHSHAHISRAKIPVYGFFKLTWGINLMDKKRKCEYYNDSKDDKIDFSIGKVTR